MVVSYFYQNLLFNYDTTDINNLPDNFENYFLKKFIIDNINKIDSNF
jgi:hypothetical protein